MNESGDYRWYQMLFLFSCAMVCVLGIYIISNKPKCFSKLIDRFFIVKLEITDNDESSTDISTGGELDQ